MEKLSIITICYNEQNLEQTCKSIVNQTWQDFEWIVVDGGSNQETLELFNRYKDRIDTFISEPDNGIYDACNKGINIAKGEYVIFMNAGDSFYSRDILNKIFAKHEYTSGVLYGNAVLFDNKQKQQIRVMEYPPLITKSFFYTANICSQSLFIKRKLYSKYGLHNLKYKIYADYERNLAFITNGENFEYIPEIISYYDSNGISSSVETQKIRLKEFQDIIKIYFDDNEIKYCEDLVNPKYKNLWERIFSIKKSITGSNYHKIITILGFKLKVKRKKFCGEI